MMDSTHNARFMLISGSAVKVHEVRKWIIVSSSNYVKTIIYARELAGLIENGTCRPNNFGHSFYASPETQVTIGLDPFKPVEHHGYFRTLKDLYNYVQVMEVIDV